MVHTLSIPYDDALLLDVSLTSTEFEVEARFLLAAVACVTLSVGVSYSADEKDVKRAKAGDKNLEKADLSGANLVGVNFSKANLTQANLTAAKLMKANFSGATMNATQINKADVSKANFTGANLVGINLSDTIVTDADFNKARVGDFWKEFLSKQKIKNFKTIVWIGY